MNRACLISLLSVFLAGCLSGNSSAHLKNAEELSRMNQYEAAIEEYRKHMDTRLAIKKRPEWENPYFYLILIGDIQLNQELPEQALLTYSEAENHGVDGQLISDRFRSMARWYEQKGELTKAFELLKSRRDKDTILVDAMLDRIAKELVAKEDALPDDLAKH